MQEGSSIRKQFSGTHLGGLARFLPVAPFVSEMQLEMELSDKILPTPIPARLKSVNAPNQRCQAEGRNWNFWRGTSTVAAGRMQCLGLRCSAECLCLLTDTLNHKTPPKQLSLARRSAIALSHWPELPSFEGEGKPPYMVIPQARTAGNRSGRRGLATEENE